MDPGLGARSPLDRICALLAASVPLIVGIWRASPVSQWRDDLTLARALTLAPIGADGAVSSVIGLMASMLPFGGRLTRVAWVSACGAALAGWALYVVGRRLLARNATTPRLTPWLALCAALTVTLSTAWQLEATVGGGSALAAGLALCGLACLGSQSADGPSAWAMGALVALTVAESAVGGIALIAALGVALLASGTLPTRRSVSSSGIAALSVLGLLWLPRLLRSLSGERWNLVGDTLLLLKGAHRFNDSAVVAHLGWIENLGLLLVGCAALGAACALFRRETRPLALALASWIAADVVWPASASHLYGQALAPLKLCALGALSILAALALQTAAAFAERRRLPFSRQAVATMPVFALTLVLVTAEESSPVAEQRARSGAEAWTDEMLDSLPPNSLLLARSQHIAWRLWAARALRGERPDLVVVPLELLDYAGVTAPLLALEPALSPLLREMAVGGRPTEFALCTLADARSLFVEFGPSWDARLLEHLEPRALLLQFQPHALGRSDREGQISGARAAFRRVLDALGQATDRDAATLSVLDAQLSAQAATLAALGDRTASLTLASELHRIRHKHPLAVSLEAELGRKDKPHIDLAALLR